MVLLTVYNNKQVPTTLSTNEDPIDFGVKRFHFVC